MYINKWLATCLMSLIASIPSVCNASSLDQLYESIGYYSSSHDVLVWLSRTSECGYIFKKGRVPAIDEVQADILKVLPRQHKQVWLDYYDSERVKSKYAQTRQIVVDLYSNLMRSGVDSNTACGMISAKVLDEFDTARGFFKRESKAYQ